MKYLVALIDGNEAIFVFPSEVDHDRMAESLLCIRFGGEHNWVRKIRKDNPEGAIISAGFIDHGQCFGHSETLKLKSRGAADTALLRGAI